MKLPAAMSRLAAIMAALSVLGAATPQSAARPSGAPLQQNGRATGAAPNAAAHAPQDAVAAPPAPRPVAPTAAETGAPRPWPEPLWLLEAPSGERAGAEGRRASAQTVRRDDGEHRGHGATGSGEAGPAGSSSRPAGDGMESMGGMGFSRGAARKTVELWRGSDPLNAAKANMDQEGLSLQVLAATGARFGAPFARSENGARATVELTDYGFYNAAVVVRTVQGGVLDVQIAQAELLKGAMSHGGRSEHDPALFKPTIDDAAPFELVREHAPDEMLWTNIRSGEKAVFVVRSFGAPVAGARVTLATQQGWRKTVTTGKDGRAEFMLIRDYFPDWSDFNRRQAGVFLVWAEAEKPQPGALDGRRYATTRYQASLTARYYPAPFDYTSYGYGVGIVVFVMVCGGLATWIYRQRRTKPYKEVVFDEKLA